jgi:methyl-accepting chemotaxis protein
VALANLTGCATKDFVRSNVDPLDQRLGKLEAKVSQLSGMTDADRAAIAQANSKSQQALDLANQAASDVKSVATDAKEANAAAVKAAMAVKEAEQAARQSKKDEKKSEKIFQLEQKK